MKNLLVLMTFVSSLSAFADSSHCKDFYKDHFKRLNLISTLVLSGDISPEFQQARLADEKELMKIVTPIMCSMPAAERLKIKDQALAELNAN